MLCGVWDRGGWERDGWTDDRIEFGVEGKKREELLYMLLTRKLNGEKADTLPM